MDSNLHRMENGDAMHNNNYFIRSILIVYLFASGAVA